MAPTPTPGAKMLYLIRRRPTASREELVANWFANHMPQVAAGQVKRAAEGKPAAYRYIASLFELGHDGLRPWDGVAQLWWDRVLPRPDIPHGTEPADTFQQKAEPYVPWPTIEYEIVDGPLPVVPNTLNPPFPATRSGFVKLVFLVAAKAGTDTAAFQRHWLEVHVPNVVALLGQVGGTRYVLSLSVEPDVDPYVGMAELWFPDDTAAAGFLNGLRPDGMETWADPAATVATRCYTELIGIP
jgi:uncharacterized protein (TIGR02118 family)